MSDEARRVAWDALRRVTEHGGYSSLVIPAGLARSRLDDRERAFVSELAFGTIRRLIPLDHAIARVASRPLERISGGALAAIRLGAYQLVYTRVPDHAAVSESVGLVSPRERGFVNAVLRKLAASPPVPNPGGSDQDVSVRTGLAEWAVRELRVLLGEESEPAAASLAERAPLALRANLCVRTLADLEQDLVASGLAATRAVVHPDVLLLDGGDPATLPGFSDGAFAVQDPASAFVVGAVAPERGDRVLDLCAGPGGKLAHIACLVGPEGLAVGGDLHPGRARLVRETVDRLRVRASVLAQDATAPAVSGGFDRVLVDAPCSGIGSARRRPELLWRADPGQVRRLARLQLRIAEAGAALLRPGGRLVYSVCTFPIAETDEVCDALVSARPDLEPVLVEGPDGTAARVRLWPHRHGTDGMFIAAFRRSD